MNPTIVWITGFPGSGKTLLARAFIAEIEDKDRWIHLDGDRMRAIMPSRHGHTMQERRRMGFFYLNLARELQSQGFSVVVSAIAPFAEIYDLLITDKNLVVRLTGPDEFLTENRPDLYSSEDFLKQVATWFLPKTSCLILENDRCKSIGELAKVVVNELGRK